MQQGWKSVKTSLVMENTVHCTLGHNFKHNHSCNPAQLHFVLSKYILAWFK